LSPLIIISNQGTRVFPIPPAHRRLGDAHYIDKTKVALAFPFCPTLKSRPSGMSFLSKALPPSDRPKAGRAPRARFKAHRGANQINKFHFESQVQKRRTCALKGLLICALRSFYSSYTT
jgi:hypothetical protein